ncbi:MAG: ABC transporter permease [Rhodospirillaceae bacterium]|nr:ABC transporter permease [Rhodospirillaceae bacterium]
MSGITNWRSLLRRPPTGDWAVFTFSIVWCLGVLLPMAGVVLFSFVRVSAEGLDLNFTLNAYREIFLTGRWEVTARTIRIAATVTAILLLISFPFALWLAKGLRSTTWKIVIWTLLTAPFFLSDTARVVIWRPVLGLMGPINSGLMELGLIERPLTWLLFSEPAVHFGLLGPFLPNMVWPIFLSLILIDDDLIEASKDIGASPWQTLRHVILPLSMPGILAGIIFSFVPMLGDDVVAKVIGGQQVLMLGGAMLDLITALNYSVAAAMSALILAIIAALQLLIVLALRRIGKGASLVEGLRK